MNLHAPQVTAAGSAGDLMALRLQEERAALIMGAHSARHMSHVYMRLAQQFPTDAGRFKLEASRNRDRARAYLRSARWKVAS